MHWFSIQLVLRSSVKMMLEMSLTNHQLGMCAALKWCRKYESLIIFGGSPDLLPLVAPLYLNALSNEIHLILDVVSKLFQLKPSQWGLSQKKNLPILKTKCTINLLWVGTYRIIVQKDLFVNFAHHSIIYFLRKLLPSVMVLISFKSSSVQHDVHFVNDGFI